MLHFQFTLNLGPKIKYRNPRACVCVCVKNGASFLIDGRSDIKKNEKRTIWV